MKRNIITLSIVCTFLCACEKDNIEPREPQRSYIQAYVEFDEIYCHINPYADYYNSRSPYPPYIPWDLYVSYAASDLTTDEFFDKYMIHLDDTNLERNRLYDSICIANNDMTFNNPDFLASPCIHRRIESIHIVSDTDYDAGHPAGTYLDDIIDISYTSAYEFIHNNYSWEGTGIDSHGDIKEGLVNFNSKHRKLIAMGFGFNFTKLPDDVNAEHRFTVTYTNEDGKVLTATSPVTRITQLKQ